MVLYSRAKPIEDLNNFWYGLHLWLVVKWIWAISLFNNRNICCISFTVQYSPLSVLLLYAWFFVRIHLPLQSLSQTLISNMVILEPTYYTVIFKIKRDPSTGVTSYPILEIVSDEEMSRRVEPVLELLESLIKTSKFKIRLAQVKMELAILDEECLDYRANKNLKNEQNAHLSYLETLLDQLSNDHSCYKCVRNCLFSLEWKSNCKITWNKTHFIVRILPTIAFNV